MTETKPSRSPEKRSTHIRVPVLAGERAAILKQAERCGLSLAGYLRNLGLGYQPESQSKRESVELLLRIEKELSRLRTVLEAMTDDTKSSDGQRIHSVLSEMRVVQTELLEAARRV
jgi:hypothetical protein